MERFVFDIGLVLFIFIGKVLLSIRRKNMPLWERPYFRFEKHLAISATLFYLIGAFFNNYSLCLITFIPLIGMIIVEIMVLRQRYLNNSL